jgi:HD-GYP domain-containing protein (c-di-GMP phosphodiesterase class II)/HAMP domain-containing protein
MIFRYPLHVHISTLFLMLVLAVGGSVGWLGYSASSEILEASADSLDERIEREVLDRFIDIIGPAETATRVLSLDGITQARSLEARLAYVAMFRELLHSSPALTSIYAGYGNGDFFLVRRLWGDEDRALFAAPAAAALLVQSIENTPGGRTGRFIFLDAALAPLRTDDKPQYAAEYDPRTRNWYRMATEANGQIKTPPYPFHTTHKVGVTIANRAPRADAVVGADLRLETLNAALAKEKVTPGTQIALVSAEGFVIAHEQLAAFTRPVRDGDTTAFVHLGETGIPVLAAVAPLLAEAAGRPLERKVVVGGEHWRIALTPFKLEGTRTLTLVNAIPDREFLAAAHILVRNLALALLAVIALAIPITLFLARRLSRDLRALDREAEDIRHFDFSRPITLRSMVREVDELAVTMDAMKRTIHRFLDISQAAAAEKDFEKLLPRLLANTLDAADAGAGILYLADGKTLAPAAAILRDGGPLPDTPAAVDLATGDNPLAAAAASGKATPAPAESGLMGRLGLAQSAARPGLGQLTAVPLRNREGSLVGAMLLLGPQAPDSAQLSFIEALSGSLAVSLEARELIHAQKRLFEAMIQLIAGAIDAKSPYTGGHCARVPELTKMLAQAACTAATGPYRDFALSDDEWEAVHVAAWLHDCGKVTTPEYVVDKATKLETLYDRIHEVRMRFEVVKRDAEIACLRRIIAGTPEGEAREALAAELKQLDDDYAFIAECNEGGEFMAPERLARLQAIAARTWQRTLDDRIGISHEEQERKARSPAQPLPVSEPLLADRPEHVFERPPRERMPADNPWCFRMPVPEVLYNKGELYNLAVARGTLSEEERYKINEHIVQTLIMLGQLPFPKHLRDVPELAACHHEKMDGTGYPRRLTREQMSPVARMMAIADIFEALTAVDRPYKKGKTLSEAIRIMSFMKKEQHIDAELFDLFLESGVYRHYAERFLRPEQIDAVDVAAYVTPAAA